MQNKADAYHYSYPYFGHPGPSHLTCLFIG